MDATIHYIAFLFAVFAIVALVLLIREIRMYINADNLLDRHHHQIIVVIRIVFVLAFSALFYLLLNY